MKKLEFNDIKQIVNLHKSRNLTYIELYKKFFMWVMDRQIELDRSRETMWMANISSPITYMICMAIYGMYQDSKVAFEVYRTIKKAKGEDITSDEAAESELISNALISLFENIYEKSDGSEEFDRCVLDAIVVGNGFGGIGYEKSEDTYEVIGENGKKEIIEEKVSMPNIYRIIPLNFFTEISATSQKKAQFNIIRKIKTASRINEDYKIYGKKYVPSEKKGEILEVKDWNMVFRFMMFSNMPNVTTLGALGLSDTYGHDNGIWAEGQIHTDIWTDNNFKIGEGLHEVYEVHTDKTMQVFIDGEEFGVFARLGPRKAKPFFKLSFRDGLNGLYDIGAGNLCYPYHKTADAFLNMRVDNDRLTGTQPLIVNSDETAFDGNDFMNWYPGKIVKVRDVEKSIKEIGITGNGAGVAASEVELLGKTVQEAVGVSGYKLGVQQKVERSATGVEELIQSADAAMKNFISSIAKAKGFIAKYVVILALYYMDDETLEKMSGMSNLKDKFDLTDFINDYTFNFDIQSISSLREAQEVEALAAFIRDYQGVTRPDGTPLIDVDIAVQELIAKKRLSPELYMDEEKAKEFMQQQIQSNGEMNQENLNVNPMAGVEEGIVPNEATAEAETTMGSPSGIEGIQAGSQGQSKVTNPLGNNQYTGEE